MHLFILYYNVIIFSILLFLYLKLLYVTIALKKMIEFKKFPLVNYKFKCNMFCEIQFWKNPRIRLENLMEI